MDRRCEPRFEIQRPVEVRILGDVVEPITGVVENWSGRGLRLLVDRHLPPETAIRVDWHEIIALGEVSYCYPVGGCYAVGLILDQYIRRTAELAALAQALQPRGGESMRPSDRARTEILKD